MRMTLEPALRVYFRKAGVMNTNGLGKCAGAVAALALSSACAGGSAIAPSNGGPSSGGMHVRFANGMAYVNGRPVTAARPHASARSPYAVLLPDRLETAPLRTYEYIINDYGTYASIFRYPKGKDQVGSINDVGGQGCTNVLYGYGVRTFWIVAADNQITKYRVPKRPLRSLSDSVGMPSSCAMNIAGDLAVGILDGTDSGAIVIYRHSKGSGTVYRTTGLAREYFDGYDNKGNLFADGFTPSYDFGLEELPKGSKTFRTITTSNTVQFPGSVQWDGTYLVVTDQIANAMYRYKVVGTQATLKSTVSLSGSLDCAQTWIATGIVYCADAGTNDGEVFKYPAGGSPIAAFSGNFDLPLGTVAAEN